MKNRRQRWFRARIALLGVCVMCVAVLVVIRAFHVQISSGDRLREMAEDQHLRHLRVSPRRGVIYARDGAELAVSAAVAPRRSSASFEDSFCSISCKLIRAPPLRRPYLVSL